MEYFTQIFHCL